MFLKQLQRDKTIFITGAGRSGLVGKFFGMRLMHLGYKVFIQAETNTPAITNSDILIAISASGNTISVIEAVEKANRLGAKVIAITANPKGALFHQAKHSLLLDSRRKKRKNKPIMIERYIPMGTAFELSSLLFLEEIITTLMQEKNIHESEMKNRHANI